jgi:hypothetical protein
LTGEYCDEWKMMPPFGVGGGFVAVAPAAGAFVAAGALVAAEAAVGGADVGWAAGAAQAARTRAAAVIKAKAASKWRGLNFVIFSSMRNSFLCIESGQDLLLSPPFFKRGLNTRTFQHSNCKASTAGGFIENQLGLQENVWFRNRFALNDAIGGQIIRAGIGCGRMREREDCVLRYTKPRRFGCQ